MTCAILSTKFHIFFHGSTFPCHSLYILGTDWLMRIEPKVKKKIDIEIGEYIPPDELAFITRLHVPYFGKGNFVTTKTAARRREESKMLRLGHYKL